MSLDLVKGKIRSWLLDLGMGKVKSHFQIIRVCLDSRGVCKTRKEEV
jgi:hypothetical protein